jgi:biopolymer transport protein TolR
MQTANGKLSAIINVTPLIDVLLVLLVTFMILPTRTRGLPSEVPQPAQDDQPAPINPQHLVLRIQKDHSIEINSEPVELARLEERLRRLFAVRPEGVLFVNGAGDLDFVVDIARGAGVARIGLMTDRQ